MNNLLPEDAVCRLQARCTLFQLPRAEDLRWDFGVRGSDICPMAGVSVLFDVLHGWALDPVITNACMNEREQCKKHMDFLTGELPEIAAKSIITVDRGYPSADMFEKFPQQYSPGLLGKHGSDQFRRRLSA